MERALGPGRDLRVTAPPALVSAQRRMFEDNHVARLQPRKAGWSPRRTHPARGYAPAVAEIPWWVSRLGTRSLIRYPALRGRDTADACFDPWPAV